MIKSLLSFILLATLLLLQISSFAQSVGSEITYKSTAASGIYEVTLVLYRSCDDLPLCTGTCGSPCTQTLTIMGSDSGYTNSNFGSFTLSLQNVRDINSNIQQCASAKNTCTNRGCATPGTFSVGYERYEFTGLSNIGPTSGIPANCCNIRFVFNTACCRQNIQTIPTSAWSNPIYQEAVINRCLSIGINNSSPIFTNVPLYIACGGENINYNNGLLDPDRDSLSFTFVPALIAYNTSISYNAPFSYDRPMPWSGNINAEIPGAGIRCDPLTGDVSFTPGNTSNQNFTGIVAFKCDQWRKINGVYKLLGTVRRECAMTILDNCAPNNTPRLVTNPPNESNPYAPKTYFETMAGQQLCFTITAKDTDVFLPTVADTTVLIWNQSLAQYGATFLPTYSGNRAVSGPREDSYQFCWTPHDSLASSVPYSFVASAGDQRCPNNGKLSRAFSIKVLANPYPFLAQKTIQCNKVTLEYKLNNSLATNVASTMLQIGNDTNDMLFLNTTNYSGKLIDTMIHHVFSKTGKYYIRFQTLVQGTTGYSVMQSIVDSVFITPLTLRSTISITPVTCIGSKNGSILSTGQLGTAPYLYKLNNDSIFRSLNYFDHLAAGKYLLTIRDATGCLALDSIIVPQPAPLQCSLLFSRNNCDTAGMLNIIASGGTAPYRFRFNQSLVQQPPPFTIYQSGKYSVETTDSNNCMLQDSIAVVIPAKLKQVISFSKNACDTAGELFIQASGGTSPYLYRLNQGSFQPNPSFDIHQSGNYYYTVKDSNNCTQHDSTNIELPAAFTYTALKNNISCFNTKDGIITLKASGGNSTGNYRYKNINTGQTNTTGVFELLDSGNYQFTITDDSNCTLTHHERFTNPKQLVIGPIKGDSIVFLNQTHLYGVINHPSLNYTWVAINGTILSDQGSSVISVIWDSAGLGLLEVEAFDSAQCSVISSKQITIGLVGMEELKQQLGISIFPNPTKNILTVSLQKLPEHTQLYVYDLHGKLVLQQELVFSQKIDLQDFPHGIYLLKIGDWHGKVVRN